MSIWSGIICTKNDKSIVSSTKYNDILFDVTLLQYINAFNPNSANFINLMESKWPGS